MRWSIIVLQSALALIRLPRWSQAQTLPSPPISPAPVTTYEYDAQGNRTKVTQAPGVAGFNFSSTSSYDKQDRLKDSTDAKAGVIQYGYNGRQDLTQVTDKFPQLHEGAHHIDRHFHGPRTAQHGGGHDGAMLGDGQGQLPSAAPT